MSENLNNILEEILKKDKKYVAEDGKILKAKIYEDSMNMDSNLIRLLANNERIKKSFFTRFAWARANMLPLLPITIFFFILFPFYNNYSCIVFWKNVFVFSSL